MTATAVAEGKENLKFLSYHSKPYFSFICFFRHIASRKTLFFVAVLAVNLLLWIDFNLNALKSSPVGEEGVGRSFISLLVQYSTHSLLCLAIMPVHWCRDRFRFVDI